MRILILILPRILGFPRDYHGALRLHLQFVHNDSLFPPRPISPQPYSDSGRKWNAVSQEIPCIHGPPPLYIQLPSFLLSPSFHQSCYYVEPTILSCTGPRSTTAVEGVGSKAPQPCHLVVLFFTKLTKTIAYTTANWQDLFCHSISSKLCDNLDLDWPQ